MSQHYKAGTLMTREDPQDKGLSSVVDRGAFFGQLRSLLYLSLVSRVLLCTLCGMARGVKDHHRLLVVRIRPETLSVHLQGMPQSPKSCHRTDARLKTSGVSPPGAFARGSEGQTKRPPKRPVEI